MYRKKVPLEDPVAYFYDEEMRTVMVINSKTIVQTRNDYHNNFNGINTINLKNFNKVISAKFCKNTKYITFLTSDYLVYQLKNYETHIGKCFRISFGK